jgi:opacity protein-like surface antigen
MLTKNLICMGIVTLMVQSTTIAQPTIAQPTIAQPTIAQPTTGKTGFYGGAALGAAALTGDSKLFVNRNVPPATPQSYNRNISGKNIAADIFIGFGKRINCFWAAIEAIASLTSLNSKDTLDITDINSQQTLSTKTTNAWGASVNLGWHINATSKLYLKLGVETRRFNINFNNPTIDPILSLNKSYRNTAFVPGLGMEVELMPRLSVRTEYRIALHPKKTVEVTGASPLITSIQTNHPLFQYGFGC